MNPGRRRILMAAAAVLLIALIGWAMRPHPTPVDVALVTRGRLEVVLDEEGMTRVKERFVVSAPFAARTHRIELDPGDPVRAGTTTLVTLDAADPALLDARSRAEAEARVKAAAEAARGAAANRERLAAQRELAESDRRRMEKLHADGVVSSETLQAAVVTARAAAESLAVAEFAAATATHELEMAQATASHAGPRASTEAVTILAPVDGVVLRRLRESEGLVAAGEPLLEVGDPSRLEIVADYLSSDAVRIHPGQPARLAQWGGGEPLVGRVRRVEPSGFTKVSALGVEEQRVNIVIDLDDRTATGLGDGYRVESNVVVWQSDDVLKVPSSCLFRAGDAWAVFTVDGGRAHLTPIEVGAQGGVEAQVLSGLGEGQQVVVHPSDAVTDGVRVERRAS